MISTFFVVSQPRVGHTSHPVLVTHRHADNTGSPPDSPLQTWIDKLDNTFISRLAERSELPLNEIADSELFMPTHDFSLHTSLCTHIDSAENDWDSVSDTAESDMVPSLTRAPSMASSSSSDGPDTDIVSIIDGGYVLESEDGMLVRRAHVDEHCDLPCPFKVLDCAKVLSSVVEFKHHIFSHFRGHPLPDFAPCFLCRHVLFREEPDDPSLVWNECLSHMVYEHLRAGQEIGIWKPDIALMRYMWNRRIITEADYKRCQLIAEPTRLPAATNLENLNNLPEVPMAPSATPPTAVQVHLSQTVGSQSEAFVVMASRRHERRQRDHSRLVARVRGHL